MQNIVKFPLFGGAKAAVTGELWLLFLWFFTAWAVNFVGDFPLNDDWAYARNVWHLSEAQTLYFDPWPAQTLIAQTVWGAAFAQIFGFSFTVLRFSTLVAGAIGLHYWYRHWIVAGAKVSTSIFLTLVLIFNPFYFTLSYSFMTEVPFLAATLAAFYHFGQFFRTNKPFYYAIGIFASIVAILIRQHGILLPIGFGIAWIFLIRQHTAYRTARTALIKNLLIALLPFALTLSVLLIYNHWRAANFGISAAYGQAASLMLPFEDGTWWNLLKIRVGTIGFYAGLFFAPVLYYLWARWWLKASWTGRFGFVFYAILGLIYYLNSWHRHTIGNVFYDWGLNPELLRDTVAENNSVEISHNIWKTIKWAGVVNSLLLYWIAGGIFIKISKFVLKTNFYPQNSPFVNKNKPFINKNNLFINKNSLIGNKNNLGQLQNWRLAMHKKGILIRMAIFVADNNEVFFSKTPRSSRKIPRYLQKIPRYLGKHIGLPLQNPSPFFKNLSPFFKNPSLFSKNPSHFSKNPSHFTAEKNDFSDKNQQNLVLRKGTNHLDGAFFRHETAFYYKNKDINGYFASIMGAVSAILYSGVLIFGQYYFDRYHLPLLLFVGWGLSPYLLDLRLQKLRFGAAILAVFALFGALATADYLDFNRARKTATDYLTLEQKISPARIDGGFEFNGWAATYHLRPQMSDKIVSWWFVDKDEFLIGCKKSPNYEQKNAYAHFRWLNLSYDSVYVYQKHRFERNDTLNLRINIDELSPIFGESQLIDNKNISFSHLYPQNKQIKGQILQRFDNNLTAKSELTLNCWACPENIAQSEQKNWVRPKGMFILWNKNRQVQHFSTAISDSMGGCLQHTFKFIPADSFKTQYLELVFVPIDTQKIIWARTELIHAQDSR